MFVLLSFSSPSTHQEFFPEQELLGAEKRQCGARGTDFALSSHSGSPCLKSSKWSLRSYPKPISVAQSHTKVLFRADSVCVPHAAPAAAHPGHPLGSPAMHSPRESELISR